jgi:hypothetical protein
MDADSDLERVELLIKHLAEVHGHLRGRSRRDAAAGPDDAIDATWSHGDATSPRQVQGQRQHADSYTFVDLLPQVRAEDLDQRDLQRRNLPVHEDAREVELDLEACVSMA